MFMSSARSFRSFVSTAILRLWNKEWWIIALTWSTTAISSLYRWIEIGSYCFTYSLVGSSVLPHSWNCKGLAKHRPNYLFYLILLITHDLFFSPQLWKSVGTRLRPSSDMWQASVTIITSMPSSMIAFASALFVLDLAFWSAESLFLWSRHG